MNFNGSTGTLNQPIGYGVVQNLTIRPGDNHIKIRAFSAFPAVFLGMSLNENGTTINMVGNSTVFNGEHIHWLEEPLASNILSVPSPGYVNTTASS